MNDLQTQDNPVTVIDLSAEEQKFCSLVAQGYSGVTAYRQAFPAKANKSYGYIRQLASDLLTKTNISTEVATRQERASRMARLSEERIEEILVDGSIDSKNNKVAETAMFMYEQANGKAIQKVQHEGKFVSVNFNLTGSKEPIPQEVLDKLKED